MTNDNTIFQNCYYIGTQFTGILFGIQLSLFYVTLKLIRRERRRNGPNVSNDKLLHLSVLFLVTTAIHVAVQAVFGEEMWIVHVDYPGGSAQYYSNFASVWYQTLDMVGGVLMNVGTDGYQIYRLWIVWNRDVRIVILPGLVLIASAVLGVIAIVLSGEPHADPFAGLALRMNLAYATSNIAINVTCCALVSARILWESRRIQKTLGKEAAHSYTGAAAIVVECMLPLALTGMAYLITDGMGHPTSILFFSLYSMSACLSPQMVIVRVLSGRAYTPTLTQGAMTSMRFKSAVIATGLTVHSDDPTNGSTENSADDIAISGLGESEKTLIPMPKLDAPELVQAV